MKAKEKIKPNKISLPSGLEVLLIPLKETETVTFLILVRAGSEYEKKEESGLSHFLEHMCFKGTKKRPSAKIISTEMDSLGAEFNAFTSQEYTGYFAKSAAEHFDKISDVITDIYLNSIFNKEEIAREKGVIIEEMHLQEDTPHTKIYDVMDELLYGNQPAGRPILGDKKVIQKIRRDNFLNYLKKHYTSHKTLVVIAGNFEEKKATETVKNFFSVINRNRGLEKPRVWEKQKSPQVLIHHKKTDQAHLILGARAFSQFDERRYTLAVLATILGEGMSSRLFQKIREEMGLAYYIHSITGLGSDHGFFGVASGLALDKIEEAIKVMYQEFIQISNQPVNQKELQKAKDYIKGKMTLGLEGSDEYAFFYGLQQLFYRRTFSLAEIFKKIDAVNSRMVQNLSRDVFRPKNINLAVLGPFQKKDEFHFKKLLK